MPVANFLARSLRSLRVLPVLTVFAWVAWGAWNGAALAMSKSQSPSSSASSSKLIWVQKADGALSCESDQGQSLEVGQKELRKAGVEVFASRKGTDGQMHIQMCGAPQGTYNFFEVRESDLPKALSLGFVRAAKRPE